MYLENKYTKIYKFIINRAKFNVYEGYTETHHVIPKSLGGTDREDNLVRLSAREHFICHLLLVRMTTGIYKTKMAQAAWMMASNISPTQQRYKVTNRTYEILKMQMSESKKGISTWNKGVTPSDGTKKKLRAATLANLVREGKLTQEEADFRNSLPIGVKPEKAKKGHSKGGWKWDEEDKQKLSEQRKGRTPWNKGKRKAAI